MLRHIANLWTLIQHPSRTQEWDLDQKLAAIANAGFDGVCWAPSAELQAGAQRHGLLFVGGMASGDRDAFPQLLDDLERFGAHHVNVQLADDALESAQALPLAESLLEQGRLRGLKLSIETHRGTCTETPEKYYALANEYQNLTGNLLPTSWDFSHFAVIKHLVPANFVDRLLLRADLIQNAQQFHFRPFNGHHAQVPITRPDGRLTEEVYEWLPFAEAVLRCWLDGNRNSGREIFVCPELGPVDGGYALSTFPNPWEDAKVLREEIERMWLRLV